MKTATIKSNKMKIYTLRELIIMMVNNAHGNNSQNFRDKIIKRVLKWPENKIIQTFKLTGLKLKKIIDGKYQIIY